MLDPLTLDQMRILVAVAETGSFSAAARRLGRVQSAVRHALHTLEHVLGVPVFARAASIMSDVEPELTLAVDATFPNDLLMGSLKALSLEFPQMPVSVFTEGL